MVLILASAVIWMLIIAMAVAMGNNAIVKIVMVTYLINIAIAATLWFITSVLRQLCPQWFEHNIVGVDRDLIEYTPSYTPR